MGREGSGGQAEGIGTHVLDFEVSARHQETACRLELTEEVPALTRKAACHCTAGGPTEMPKERKDPPSHTRRTREAWPKRHVGRWGQAERRIQMRRGLGEKIRVQKWGERGAGRKSP